MKEVRIQLALKKLKQTFYVREKLDDKWVDTLATFDKEGVDLGDLLVSKEKDGSFDNVDGRHRKAAYERNGRTKAWCIVREFNSQTEKILEAYKRNLGGSLPPNEDDTEHTIKLLLQAGESRKDIIELMSIKTKLPAMLIRGYVNTVQAALYSARVALALNAVTEGKVNLVEAADKYKVELKALQKKFKSQSRDKKGHTTRVRMLKQHINHAFKKVTHAISRNLGMISKEANDGVAKTSDIEEVANHVTMHVNKLILHNNNWVRRLSVKAQTHEKVLEVSRRETPSSGSRLAKRVLSKVNR